MTRTDGEHELVLGNKQLLSAFFVVVVLLGVFFTMGYFVGKNTATGGFNAGQPGANGGPRPDAAGKAIDTGTASSSAPPDSTASAVDPNSSTPAATPSTPPPAPDPVEIKTDPPAPAPVVHSQPAPANDEAIAQTSLEEMYLQVSAVRRSDADNMVKVLRERGFPALLGESSKQGLFRVLVGPFKTHSDLGHAKADLKAKGFDSIVAK
jgi:cell division septation protein DedD